MTKTKEELLLKSTYYYDLPEDLIAQEPVYPRDSSRLLAFNINEQKIEHKIFRDVLDYFNPGDVLVVNNSRVLPARLYGKKETTNANIEILLQKRINLNIWKVIAKPTKRLSIGTKVIFSDELYCVVKEIKEYGECVVEFVYEGAFEAILDKIGTMPLPPYIKKKLDDQERYQTVYSKEKGSSAAPTAGLHFTPELLQKLKDKGVIILEVLLHVGLGTFRPVKEENILEHKMHSEYFSISQSVADEINKAKEEGRRVFVCGTTSVRVLESAAYDCGDGKYKLKETSGETDIFIYPSYKFKIVDCLITNFHLPESTLVMLVSAFCGYENTMNVYEEAVNEKYRFFSFGDACLFYK